MATVLRRLFVSDCLKRTCKLENCARTGLRYLCRGNRFRSAPYSCHARVNWSVEKNYASRFGPKTRLSTLTTRSIQPLPRFDWHWETKLTILGSWRLCLVAVTASSVQWKSQVHWHRHRLLRRLVLRDLRREETG